MPDLFAGGYNDDATAPPIPTAATVQRTSSYCIPFHWNWKVYCVNVLWMRFFSSLPVLLRQNCAVTCVFSPHSRNYERTPGESRIPFLRPARIDFTSGHSVNIVLDVSLCWKLAPAQNVLSQDIPSVPTRNVFRRKKMNLWNVLTAQLEVKQKLRRLSPQANYTDRATAAWQRS
jgi:hypothetical protein